MITERLTLIPATVALCDAEGRSAAAVGQALGARVPASWPPPVFEPDDVARVRRQLVADPAAGRWTLHYVLRRAESEGDLPALIGIAGYVAPPTRNGAVEIGYAIVEEFQRVGFATEAVQALLTDAFADSGVRVVVATTYASLHPSIRVLEKSGFIETSHVPGTGLMRFERQRSTLASPAA
jgi:ribosomal-protein-alanine N-acetyltransferase